MRLATMDLGTTPATGNEYGNAPTFEGSNSVGTGAAITKETTVKRSGAGSRKYDAGASNGTAYTAHRHHVESLLGRGWYVRGYFQVPALPGADAYIAALRVTGAANLALVKLTTGGKVQLFNPSGVQVGSDSAATVSVDTWYRVEVYGVSGTGAVDAIELRLEGTSVASATGQAYQEDPVEQFHHGWLSEPGANKLIYWDDVAINDSQGSAQNAWPGTGKVVYLNALSDSARGGWVAGGGATTNLYAAVDNDPPVGVASGSATDTSQIKNTGTTNPDNYDATMQTYSTGGLVAGDVISLVQPLVQHGRFGIETVPGALQVVSNPSGSEESVGLGSLNGADIGTYPENWETRWGAAITSPSVVLGTSPVVRVGRRGSQTTDAHCCGMRLAVEYIAAAGGAAGAPNMLLMGVG